MSNEAFTKIADFLAANPGAISQEIGVSPVEMGRLEKEGKVVRVGKRQTGTRGRPPVEWALPTAEAATATILPNMPKLADATNARQHGTDDEIKVLDYIENVFAGRTVILRPNHPRYGVWADGIREDADYNLLAARYKEVVGQINRRNASSVNTTI